MSEIKLESGRTPVAQRLYDSSVSVIASTEPPADNLAELALVLKRIANNLANMLSAASCCEREPVRQQKAAMQMFGQDKESAALVLKQMDEAVERIGVVRAGIIAAQN